MTGCHCNDRILWSGFCQGGGLEGSTLPLLATEKSTWEAAQQVSAITPDILPSSARKIEEAKVNLLSFAKHQCLFVIHMLPQA